MHCGEVFFTVALNSGPGTRKSPGVFVEGTDMNFTGSSLECLQVLED